MLLVSNLENSMDIQIVGGFGAGGCWFTESRRSTPIHKRAASEKLSSTHLLQAQLLGCCCVSSRERQWQSFP